MNGTERNPFYGNPYLDAPLIDPPPADDPGPLCTGEAARAPKKTRRMRAQCATEVQDGEVRYLWKPYILRGDVTIMAAAGGTGKTFALCGIASELSNGRYPLNPFERFDPMTVLFISAEDPDFVLRERLKRTGANLDRIFLLDAQNSAHLRLSDSAGQPDLCDLEELIDGCKPDLVIIDPLHAFIGSAVKMTEQSVIRPFMQALASLCKRHDCAIVDVAHTNKRPAGANANDAILGATDIVNASRSVLRVIFDETGKDPNRRVIVHTKSNYAAMGQSVAFEIDRDGKLTFTGYSDVTRGDLEAAARSNRSLSEHLSALEADRTAKAYVIDRLVSLAMEQSEPKKFYSYETLRSCGISGKSDIVPNLAALAEHGVGVVFPKTARRTDSKDGKSRKGFLLIRYDSER